MSNHRTNKNKPRYVAQEDTSAKLVAWGGANPQSDLSPLGGWTGNEPKAFYDAIQDGALTFAGEPLRFVEILDARTCRPVLTVIDRG